MALIELLSEHRTAVWQAWRDRILDTYPAKSAKAFKKGSDPFANPLGHTVSTATQKIVDALIEGVDPSELAPHLEEIVKLRSIQDFSPSRAVAFAFELKDVVRQTLAGELADDAPQLQAELRDFEAKLEMLGFMAFDVYVACRERLFEVRINELKRSVNTLVRRAGNPDLDT
jgi:hypothetical protein